jgi:hypothetical protein
MGLAQLLCLDRPDIGEDGYQHLAGSSRDIHISEKVVANDDDDEDGMQSRLSDLRKVINDAKVDW